MIKFKLFRKKHNTLEKLIIDFLKNGYKELGKIQGSEMQKHYWKHKAKEDKQRVIDRYNYLKYRKKSDLEFTEENKKEFEYAEFLYKYKYKLKD